MDNETRSVLNDLIDVTDALSDIVREINPGADFQFIDFVMQRANRTMLQANASEHSNGER